jgi:hypothetical protein
VQSETTGSVGVNARGGRGRSAGHSTGTTVNAVSLLEGMGSTAGFGVQHEVTVTLRRRGAKDEVLTDPDWTFGMSIWLAADLLPAASEFRNVPRRQLPEWMRDRLTPLAVDARTLHARAREQVLDELRPGWYIDPEGEQHLREFTGVDHLAASLLELTTAGLRTSVLTRSVTGRTRWVDVELVGRPGETELLTVGDLLTGDINLTLNSLGADQGRSLAGGGGANLAGGGSQLDVPKGGGGINGSAGADRGANWSALGIWGREFLGIELGKHHTGLLGLDIDVRTGRDVGSREPAVETVGAMVWHAIPERDVLDAYAAGRHDLPLDVVADAVERMVSGDLLLDLRTTRC